MECNHNDLESLPALPAKLQSFFCSYNKLRSLPPLPNNLIILYCDNNNINILPNLPDNFGFLDCKNTPFYNNMKQYISSDDYDSQLVDIDIINDIINILNKFRFLYYTLKYKKQFRKLLWEKIREPKIRIANHPDILQKLLLEDNVNENEDEFNQIIETFGTQTIY
jgi:hypothetical protein